MMRLNLTLINILFVLICVQEIIRYGDGGVEYQILFAEAFVTTPRDSLSSRSNTSTFLSKKKYFGRTNKFNDRLMMLPSDFSVITSAYTSSLAEYPLLTKSATGFFLCGTGDILAQSRANSNDEVSSLSKIEWKRLLRFASKGAFGTIIWVQWYDLSDEFVNHLSIFENLTGSGHEIAAGILRTILLILMEQFIACPLVFGCWELPVATVLNGAPISDIKYEIKSKLGRMLKENAKIWTFANMIIYNAPVQYRAALGNLIDILWQSIVSDFAADCGRGSTMEECLMDDDGDAETIVMTDEAVKITQ